MGQTGKNIAEGNRNKAGNPRDRKSRKGKEPNRVTERESNVSRTRRLCPEGSFFWADSAKKIAMERVQLECPTSNIVSRRLMTKEAKQKRA